MRGRPDPQITTLAFIDLEERVPAGHPLRTVKRLADEALAELSSLFDAMYAEVGRPSIPPERLLKASLLIALYSVRSERAFCEELEYNLLFRWFLDMDPIEPSFDPTVFTKNRARLLEREVGQQLFDEVVGQAHERGLLSDEHFTVDGTLIEATASLKSFKRKDGEPATTTDGDSGNPSVDFHGEKRSNATHQSTTDPDARLMTWTGSELLLWNSREAGGGAYDLAADRWRPLAPAGGPRRRVPATVLWTGREMVIWGGLAVSPPGEEGWIGPALDDGARYNPATDTWSPLPHGGEPRPRTGCSAVWTGGELLIWGGLDQRHYFGDGARLRL